MIFKKNTFETQWKDWKIRLNKISQGQNHKEIK